MELDKKKEGYGYLIKWIIGFGDLIIINLSFIFLYRLFLWIGVPTDRLCDYMSGTSFLLINLAYFIAASIIPPRISSNIIFFDKIIQRSFSFISLFFILFTAGTVLFDITGATWREWFLFYFGLSFIYIVWHVILRSTLKLYRRKGYNFKRIIIVGGGSKALSMYHEIKSGEYGYKIMGVFSANEPVYAPGCYQGKLAEIEKFCIENDVDEIYCTLSHSYETAIIKLVNFAESNMIRFFLVPDFYSYIPRKLTLNFLQSTPVITIRPEPLQMLPNRLVKRVFDILFSLLVLTTVFPVIFIIVGALIKLTSPGPVFFKQLRTGFQGKEFYCYKFRSMKLNEEADSIVAGESDSRITKIGAFIRRTSIDELPQFFNVLIGNMSVAGPRPHMIKQTKLYEQLIDKFMIRHVIKPGITGWAQISGYRGETRTIQQMEERLRRDVWYIENWSFILDIKIIVVTVIQILKGDKNAR